MVLLNFMLQQSERLLESKATMIRSHCEARQSRGNPTKRRAAFSVTSNIIYDKGITTSGNNKVIYCALLVMTLLLLCRLSVTAKR